MSTLRKLHKNESGLSALETAIILIAFIVVASVFAFTILSAGSASTDKSKQAINAGLQGVQSSMAVKGDVIGKGDSATPPTSVDSAIFTMALVSGGDPVDLSGTSADTRKVIVSYVDAKQTANNLDYTVTYIGSNNSNTLLEGSELAEFTVDLSSLSPALPANTNFTIEIKPPTGSVIKLDRTTPAAIEAVMNLH
jgi:archaeal flagellin FlaB